MRLEQLSAGSNGSEQLRPGLTSEPFRAGPISEREAAVAGGEGEGESKVKAVDIVRMLRSMKAIGGGQGLHY